MEVNYLDLALIGFVYGIVGAFLAYTVASHFVPYKWLADRSHVLAHIGMCLPYMLISRLSANLEFGKFTLIFLFCFVGTVVGWALFGWVMDRLQKSRKGTKKST